MDKKVYFVSNTGWSFVHFRIDLLSAMLADGYHVTVLAPPDQYVQQLEALGLRFIALSSLSNQSMNPYREWQLYKEFKRIYSRERPDIVIQYTVKPNVYSTLAAASLGIPVIAVITGLGYAFINGGLVPYVVRQLYRLALRKAKQVWFLNEDDQALFIKNGLVKKSKTKRIPSEGIDCHGHFNPEFMSDGRPLETHAIQYLFVGRLLYDKGIREYVDAAANVKQKHPNVRFQILGYLNVDNPAAVRKEELMKWVENGTVEYLGDTDDVRPYVLQADCVVLPSYREGMSTVLQESASLGKPIIASNIAGCRELVDDGSTGFLCKVKNVESLTERMEMFLTLTEDQRRSMGLRGRKKMIEGFGIEQIIDIYKAEIPLLIDPV